MNTILDLLLTNNLKQRLRIRRSLLASLVFLICICMLVYLMLIGKMDRFAGTLLTVGMLFSCLIFYVLMRTGMNLSFLDPSLTMPQILVAMTWICAAYASSGVVHACTLMLFALVMVFGIFTMNVRSAMISASYGSICLVSTVIYKTQTDPIQYPWSTEIVYVILMMTIMPTIAILSEQMTEMRRRINAQKEELLRAIGEIQKIASHDELTGLFNRRKMTEILADYHSRHVRHVDGFAVAMIDLDHFKKINDQFGHAVGDEVLVGFGRAAKEILRQVDVICRWGGEEFLLLLPNSSHCSPCAGIDRLREHMKHQSLSSQALELRVSFSVGLATFRDGESVYETIKRADIALYAAKRAGRDCTIIEP